MVNASSRRVRSPGDTIVNEWLMPTRASSVPKRPKCQKKRLKTSQSASGVPQWHGLGALIINHCPYFYRNKFFSLQSKSHKRRREHGHSSYRVWERQAGNFLTRILRHVGIMD